ncbi:MAG: 16S rRNA (adenine(1518)-N(6)/adenine(1519)-N(6))-dimethyltransferase RsmA [Erysipelotrichaceae bacterium]
MDKSMKQLISQYAIKAKKKFGQNFLLDQNIINKIVKESKIDNNSVVVEIGAGLGALTRVLAQKAKKVLAFEIDDDLVTILPEILSDYSNVEIIHQDFLVTDLADILKDYLSQDLVVCANLPYYITTPILFKIFESEVLVDRIAVMMQKEVAERFVAAPKTKDYNALSVISQYKYDISLIVKVPKQVFHPAPNVDSAVVLFKRKHLQKQLDETSFFPFVKACFKQRRKTIFNNLKEYLDKELANKVLNASNIALSTRSEELTLDDFQLLFESYLNLV